MFLDKKTVLKIWLNLGLNLTIFRGTGPTDYIREYVTLYKCVTGVCFKREKGSYQHLQTFFSIPLFSVGLGGGWILPLTNFNNLETITLQKPSQPRTIPSRDMATLV